MFFVEAKWLYNYILSQEKPFEFDYKTTKVKVKNKDGEFEDRELKFLPAKNRQDVVYLLHQNIKALAKAKQKHLKVGKLKFRASYNCIDLSQNGVTHKIVSKRRLKINGIKRPLLIQGLKQVQEDYEIANAKLIKKAGGYYIKLTCYEYIKPEQIIKKDKEAGLDFGIKNNITTSDGEVFNVCIGETEHLKRLQQKIARQVKGSNNRYRTRLKLQREYEKIDNKKKDAINKVVNYLLGNYNKVYMQDESLRGWQGGWYGKQVQHSCMGGIKAKLKASKSVGIVGKWFPSTKMCYRCGKLNNIALDDRIYRCECGLVEDRDWKSAKIILHVGQCNNKFVPMEYREVKPVEKETSGLTCKHVSVSHILMKQEASSFRER